jgi:uncharacterized lipoprotein YajG
METKNHGKKAKQVLTFQKEKEMKKSYLFIAIALIATLILGACGTTAETPVATEAPVVEQPTEAPATEAPTEAPVEATSSHPAYLG